MHLGHDWGGKAVSCCGILLMIGHSTALPQCLRGEQGLPVELFVVARDRLQRNVTYSLQHGSLGGGVCEPSGEENCSIKMVFVQRGVFALQIFADGDEAPPPPSHPSKSLPIHSPQITKPAQPGKLLIFAALLVSAGRH